MTHKSIVIMLLIIFLCSLTLVSSSPLAAAAHADEVSIAIESRPSVLCPLTSSSAYSKMLWELVAEPPIGMTPTGELYAGLCSTIPSTENGDLVRNTNGTVLTTIRFRPGLLWSDGVRITIDDYIFTYRMYASGKVASYNLTNLIVGVKRVDDLTCTVTWSRWDPYIPCGWEIYPQHLLGPIFDKDPNLIGTCDYLKNPVHAGPYVLVSNNDAAASFRANPLYRQKGKPHIANVTVVYENNATALTAGLISGKLDVASQNISMADAQAFKDGHGDQFDVLLNDSTSAGIMQWNLTSPFFSDKRVRQAFYYGIDRNLVTASSGLGYVAVMSPIPSSSKYCTSPLVKYDYSVDKANALLDAAGWKWNTAHTERILPDGSAAVLKVQTSGVTIRATELAVIQPELAQLGMTLTQVYVPFETMLANETSGNYVMTIHGVSFDTYDLLGSVSQFSTGKNVARYSSAEMDQWINAAQKATTVDDLRTAYTHIQDIWAEDLPCLYLEQTIEPDIVCKGLKGYDHAFSSSSAYCMWNIADWRWGNVVSAQSLGDATGGSISSEPSLVVDNGASATFQVSVASGYKATVSVGTLDGATWTIPNVTSDMLVTVTFAKKQTTLTLVLQIGSTRMTVTGEGSSTVVLDAAPVLGAGNRTLVPVRAVAEAMGGTVGWNASTRTASVTVGSQTLELTLGKSTAYCNGVATAIDTDPKVVPMIINGRTMLPLRFVVESLGAQVSYDQATKTITITYTAG